jgi:hypothetical protein
MSKCYYENGLKCFSPQELNMPLDKKIFSIYSLTEENWMKHANPRCVITRYASLPIIILAFWSRVWIGWWSIIPIIMALAWMIFNPLLFKNAASTNNWASKSVMGELVLQNMDKIAIPEPHKKLSGILKNLFVLGLILSIVAMGSLDVWLAVFGISLVYVSRSWFMDRMVWLYEDMKHIPEYGKWLY